MNITAKKSAKWHQTQMQFLVERCYSSAHCNYNLDESVAVKEYFTEWYSKFLVELNETSPNYRVRHTGKKRKLMEVTTPITRRKHRKLEQSPKIRNRG